MLEFKLMNMKICLSFTFFALIAVVTFWDSSWGFKVLTALMCCILHECGHILMMSAFGSAPQKVIFYGGGIKIVPFKERLISHSQDVLVLSAGCAVNLLIALAIYAITGELGYFGSANLFLGLFNLLPFKYFDGGQMLSIICNENKIYDFIKSFCLIFFAAVMCKMIFSGQVSISLFVTFGYIVISELLA